MPWNNDPEQIPKLLACGVFLFWLGWGLILAYGKRCSICNGRLRESGVAGWSEREGHWTHYHCKRCGRGTTYSQYGS